MAVQVTIVESGHYRKLFRDFGWHFWLAPGGREYEQGVWQRRG